MTALQVAQVLGGKRIGRGRYLAKCPAHPDRKPSLSIDEGKSWVLLKCQSHGCDYRSILAAAGLTVADISYRNTVDPAELQRLFQQQKAEERASRNLCVGEWILRFIDQGYTRENRAADITTVCACAIVLRNKSSAHWERILETHLARIMAAEHCRERRILPETAA